MSKGKRNRRRRDSLTTPVVEKPIGFSFDLGFQIDGADPDAEELIRQVTWQQAENLGDRLARAFRRAGIEGVQITDMDHYRKGDDLDPR